MFICLELVKLSGYQNLCHTNWFITHKKAQMSLPVPSLSMQFDLKSRTVFLISPVDKKDMWIIDIAVNDWNNLLCKVLQLIILTSIPNSSHMVSVSIFYIKQDEVQCWWGRSVGEYHIRGGRFNIAWRQPRHHFT